MLPAVEEANSISEELDKKRKFDLMIVSPEGRGELSGRTEVMTITSLGMKICLNFVLFIRVLLQLKIKIICCKCLIENEDLRIRFNCFVLFLVILRIKN